MAKTTKTKKPVEALTQEEIRASLGKRFDSLDNEEDDPDFEPNDEDDFDDDDEILDDAPPPAPIPVRKLPQPSNRLKKMQDRQMVEEDIFDFCEREMVGKGVPIRYIIKKNASYVTECDHPCSWAELQEKYGGGVYTVRARNVFNKQFVKVQSMSISDIVQPTQTNVSQPRLNQRFEAPEQQDEDYNMNEPRVIERIIEREPTQPAINYLELFGIINKSNSESQNAVKEAQKESQQAQNMLMATLLQIATKPPPPQEAKSDDKIMSLMMQMQQNTNQMFEKMMENTQRSIESVQKNSEKMMDKVAERIEKLDGAKNTNGMAYTPEQIMQLMMQGQDRGFQMWQQMEKMADMKAAQRFDVLEATRETAVEDSRPKTMTEKLIDTMLPVVASAIQAQAISVANQQAAANQVAQPTPAQVRPPVKQIQPAQQQPVQRPRPKPAPQAAQAENAKTEAPRNVTPAHTKKDSHNFPSAVPAQVETVVAEAVVAPVDDEKFGVYMNHAAIVLTEGYTGQKPIPNCALALIESLKTQRIGLVDFIHTCNLEKVYTTLISYGAEQTVLDYVKEVYAYIEAAIANGEYI